MSALERDTRCIACGGLGTDPAVVTTSNGMPRSVVVPCPNCNGTGIWVERLNPGRWVEGESFDGWYLGPESVDTVALYRNADDGAWKIESDGQVAISAGDIAAAERIIRWEEERAHDDD